MIAVFDFLQELFSGKEMLLSMSYRNNNRCTGLELVELFLEGLIGGNEKFRA